MTAQIRLSYLVYLACRPLSGLSALRSSWKSVAAWFGRLALLRRLSMSLHEMPVYFKIANLPGYAHISLTGRAATRNPPEACPAGHLRHDCALVPAARGLHIGQQHLGRYLCRLLYVDIAAKRNKPLHGLKWDCGLFSAGDPRELLWPLR
jgi:hypothetical protein